MKGDTDGPEIDFVGISKPTNSMLDFNISVDDGPQEDGRDSCTASKTDF